MLIKIVKLTLKIEKPEAWSLHKSETLNNPK